MEELKNIRKLNKLSCQDMAKTLNISKCFYWQIENKRRKLSYEMAYKISKIFNKKPDDLFYNQYKNLE